MEIASRRASGGVLAAFVLRGLLFAALTVAALAVSVLLADSRIDPSAAADLREDEIIYAVRCLQSADDERTVWAMRQPCRLQNIDLATGRMLVDTPLQNGLATGLQVNSTGSHVALCDQYGNPQILRQGYERTPGLTARSGRTDLFALSPRGNGILLTTPVSLELWSLDETPQLLAVAPLDGSLSAIEWSPDGSQVLAMHGNGDLILHDGQTLKIMAATASETISCTDASWSADSRFVLAYGPSGPMAVWDTWSEDEPRHIENCYCSVAGLSSDGQWIIQADMDHHLWLMNVLRPQDRHGLGTLSMPATAVCFTPDGKHLVVGVLNGDLVCWSLADRRVCWQLSGKEL